MDTENTGKLLLQKGGLRRRVTIIPLNKIQRHPIPQRIQNAAVKLVGLQTISLMCFIYYFSCHQEMLFYPGWQRQCWSGTFSSWIWPRTASMLPHKKSFLCWIYFIYLVRVFSLVISSQCQILDYYHFVWVLSAVLLCYCITFSFGTNIIHSHQGGILDLVLNLLLQNVKCKCL